MTFPGTWISSGVLYVYALIMACQFFFALGNKPGSSGNFYFFSSIVLGLTMYITLFLGGSYIS